MTCAHVVNVALTKVEGVDRVDVSLNKALATVKLKPGNKASLAQMLKLIHEKGYTIPQVSLELRGDPSKTQVGMVFKASGTGESFALAIDPKMPGAYDDVSKRLGESIVIRGSMRLAKDLKVSVPLVVNQVR